MSTRRVESAMTTEIPARPQRVQVVDAADVLLDLGEHLTVREIGDLQAPDRQLEVLGDLLREVRVRVAGEDADQSSHRG